MCFNPRESHETTFEIRTPSTATTPRIAAPVAVASVNPSATDTSQFGKYRCHCEKKTLDHS